jgi:cytochrome c oxidase subunit II
MNPSSYKDWLPLPPDLSTHGPAIDHLIIVVHIIMGILFVGWGAFFVYCLIRFRKRPGHQAQYTPVKGSISKFVEVGVIIAEAILLINLSMPVWAAYKRVPPEKDAMVVRVVAQQFAWNFHYPGKDGIFGKTDVKYINDTDNFIGVNRNDPHGKDDIISTNIFHFPVNRTVVVRITSQDVIHSFTINVLRIKQDAIPGIENTVWFKAIKTGQYDISCAQLCGNSHFKMQGFAYIDTPEEFAKWMSEQESELQGASQ